MFTVTWLRMSAIGLPLIAGFIIWRWRDRPDVPRRWLAAAIFALMAVIALTFFLLNRHYACILRVGRENCVMDGLGALTLFLLSIFLARRAMIIRETNQGQSYMLMLMLASAWAGMALAQNLLEDLLFINFFVYVIYRWLKSEGLKFRILALRDDYADEPDSTVRR